MIEIKPSRNFLNSCVNLHTEFISVAVAKTSVAHVNHEDSVHKRVLDSELRRIDERISKLRQTI